MLQDEIHRSQGKNIAYSLPKGISKHTKNKMLSLKLISLLTSCAPAVAENKINNNTYK